MPYSEPPLGIRDAAGHWWYPTFTMSGRATAEQRDAVERSATSWPRIGNLVKGDAVSTHEPI
jgi:hypothetical protein